MIRYLESLAMVLGFYILAAIAPELHVNGLPLIGLAVLAGLLIRFGVPVHSEVEK